MDVVKLKILFRAALLGSWKVHILHPAAEGPAMRMLKEQGRPGPEANLGTARLRPGLQARHGWPRPEAGAEAGIPPPPCSFLTG